jgi:hypothetical protein
MIRQPNDMVPSRNARVFAGLVAVLSVLSSGYFTVSGLVDPGQLVPGGGAAASRTFAAYVSARSIVLLGAVIWLLAVRAWRPLGLLLALNGAVQLIDASIGAVHHQVAQTVGPVCFAVALLVAAFLLGGRKLTPGQPATSQG